LIYAEREDINLIGERERESWTIVILVEQGECLLELKLKDLVVGELVSHSFFQKLEYYV